MNHTPHILASVFLCGLWLPMWLLIASTYNPPWHCQFCGYSAALKYLQNPRLYAQEQADAQRRYAIREQTRIDRTGSTLQEQIAYFISDHQTSVIIGGIIIGTVVVMTVYTSFVVKPAMQQAAVTPTPRPTVETPATRRKTIADELATEYRPRFPDVVAYLQSGEPETLVISTTQITEAFVYDFKGSKNAGYLAKLKDAGFKTVVIKNLSKEWKFKL